MGRLLNFPPIPEVPEPVRGKSFVVIDAYHSGDPAQADELLAPLRALGPVNDTIRTVSMPEMSHVHMDPEGPAAGVGDSMTLAGLPAEALDTFIEVAGGEDGRELAVTELRHLEGELSRARLEHGALASIAAKYNMIAGGFAPVPELVAPTLERVGAITRALAPWAALQMYLNFADTSRDPANFWPAATYERLRRIKAAVDPGDVIRSNHPVPPLV